MNTKVKPVPVGYHTVTPYLAVHDAGKLLEFLKAAFQAELTTHCIKAADGSFKHVEIEIGDSKLMIGEASKDNPPTPATFYMYFENVDKVYKQAMAAGASSIMEPMNLFYGDRNAAVKDSHGNQWYIASRVEDLSEEEIQKRADQANYGHGDHSKYGV